MPISKPFLLILFFSRRGNSIGFIHRFAGLVHFQRSITSPRKSTGKINGIHPFFKFPFSAAAGIADKFNVLQMGIIAAERVFKVMDNEDFIRIT